MLRIRNDLLYVGAYSDETRSGLSACHPMKGAEFIADASPMNPEKFYVNLRKRE